MAVAGPPTASVMPNNPPTLFDADTPFKHGRVLDLDDAGEFTGEAIFGTLAKASGTLVIGGTVSAGDKVTVTFFTATSGVLAVITVVATTTTTGSVATLIANAVNNHGVLQRAISASVSSSTVTFTAIHPGVLGNFIFLLAVPTASITCTPSTKTALTSGTGGMATALENCAVQLGRETLALHANRSIQVGIVAQGVLSTCGRLVV